jgi:hypothetical protein
MRIQLLWVVVTAVFAQVSPCYSKGLPPLKDTRLFSSIAKDCSAVDLDHWQHPTRSLLLKRHVQIEKVQICNGGNYPIFFVRFPYDPQGQTKSYFGPLFDKMRIANGGWPYSFVALSDNTVLNVSYGPTGYPDLEYEMYAP